MKKMKLIFPGCWFADDECLRGRRHQYGCAAWLSRPLSVADALNTALIQNATILKAKNDFEASQGWSSRRAQSPCRRSRPAAVSG